MVMALDYAGYHFPTGRFRQPEDNLTEFMFNDPEVLAYYKRAMPAMYAAFDRGDNGAFAPNLVHIVLAFATNLWLGTNAVTFRENNRIVDILKEVREGRPVVLSGSYPYTFLNGSKGTLGHINVLAGATYKAPSVSTLTAAPESVSIDDPFGDYRANFAPTSRRRDITMSWADFIRLCRPLGDTAVKWGHFIKPGAALVS